MTRFCAPMLPNERGGINRCSLELLHSHKSRFMIMAEVHMVNLEMKPNPPKNQCLESLLFLSLPNTTVSWWHSAKWGSVWVAVKWVLQTFSVTSYIKCLLKCWFKVRKFIRWWLLGKASHERIKSILCCVRIKCFSICVNGCVPFFKRKIRQSSFHGEFNLISNQ